MRLLKLPPFPPKIGGFIKRTNEPEYGTIVRTHELGKYMPGCNIDSAYTLARLELRMTRHKFDSLKWEFKEINPYELREWVDSWSKYSLLSKEEMKRKLDNGEIPKEDLLIMGYSSINRVWNFDLSHLNSDYYKFDMIRRAVNKGDDVASLIKYEELILDGNHRAVIAREMSFNEINAFCAVLTIEEKEDFRRIWR